MHFRKESLNFQFFRFHHTGRFVSGMAAFLLPLVLLPAELGARVGPADYARALDLQGKYRGLVLHSPDGVEWIEGTNSFVYRRRLANRPSITHAWLKS
jgi:hypothetical protein